MLVMPTCFCPVATSLPITATPLTLPACIYKSHPQTSSPRHPSVIKRLVKLLLIIKNRNSCLTDEELPFCFLIMPLRYFISGPFLVLILRFIIYSLLAHHLL